MQRILIGLAVLNFVLLCLAFVAGFDTEPRATVEGLAGNPEALRDLQQLNRAFHRHFLLGLLAGVTTLLVHSVVMTYFIGTGRWVKEAVERWHLDEAYDRQTRRFKARAFPFAFFSMLLVIATTMLGAATDTGTVPAWVHLTVAMVAIVFNLVSYVFEYRTIGDNIRLLNDVASAASAKQPHRRR